MPTITEALAEIKTIDQRLDKKRQFVVNYLMRQEQIKDPLEKDGGSRIAIEKERQSIADLGERKIAIRKAIQAANASTTVTVNGVTRTIADWLVWRREVAPIVKEFLNEMAGEIKKVRDEARRKGLSIVTTGDVATRATDIIVNIDEGQLAKDNEDLETTLGILDGQLSLCNATTMIALP